MKKNLSPLFIHEDLIAKYNATGAYIFAHIAYHIATKGNFDTAPRALANYVRCSKVTAIKYIALFIRDGILIEQKGKRDYRSALGFSEDEKFEEVYDSYRSLRKTHVKTTKSTGLVLIDVSKVMYTQDNKQEFTRKETYFTCWARDKLANQQLNEKEYISLDSISALSLRFNLAANTIKKVLRSLAKKELIKYIGNFGSLIMAAGDALTDRVNTKANEIKNALNRKAQRRMQPQT
jgi:DNA-binding transcriptional regulator YhcF (GntR family)